MNEFKQNLIIGLLVLTTACLGMILFSLYTLVDTVFEIREIAVKEAEVIVKDAGSYLRDEHADDLKNWTQEQIDSLKAISKNIWHRE